MDVLAERLIFVSDGKLSSVKITTDKKAYETREKVSIDVEPMLSEGDSILSTLSVAVVNEGYFSAQGNTQSIQSYLLLDPELKGAIESPAHYFLNEESISSSQKLDLLMMVQGWRSYYWDDIITKASKDLAGWDDAGVSVSGVMKRLFKDKTVMGGAIQLNCFSPLIVEKTQTDSLGRFRFERLFLKDSAEVKLTRVNEKGSKSVHIIPDKPSALDTLISQESIREVLPDIGIPMKYAQENYFKKLAWQDYDPDKGSILLEGVKVNAKSRNTTKQVDFYKSEFYNVDETYLITPADYKYKNVHNFLLEKAKLPVDSWFIDKNGYSRAKIWYVLDGEIKFSVDIRDESQQVLDLPIKNIYQIDVNRTLQIGEYVRGVTGVAYVYTKKFDLAVPSNSTVQGTAIINVRGFQKPKKFYSPTYTPENINLTMMDYRPTLYWTPELAVKEGKATLDFFTCDNLSNYVVIVEGISKEGKICFGVKQFTVNKQRNN